MDGSLSACIIVKNEEKRLPECLAAIRRLAPVVDEVCIYDTGSTDATIALATSLGARVEQGYWDDDFGRARNAALAMASHQFAIVVDSDEHLQGDPARLAAVVADMAAQRADTGSITVVNIDERGRATTSFDSPRILNLRTVRYKHRVHEMPELIRGGREKRVYGVELQTVSIAHHGYLNQETYRLKGQRNARLADLNESEVDPAGAPEWLAKRWVDKGRSCQAAGDFDNAVDFFVKVRAMPLSTDNLHRSWAGEELVSTLIAAGRLPEAEAVMTELRHEPVQVDCFFWLLGRLRLAQGRYREARDILREVRDPQIAGLITLDGGVVVESLMLACAHCGEIDEAISYAVQLMSHRGTTSGYGDLLLAMWADRPVHQLAEVFQQFAPAYLESLAADFATCRAPGPALAGLLGTNRREPSRVAAG